MKSVYIRFQFQTFRGVSPEGCTEARSSVAGPSCGTIFAADVLTVHEMFRAIRARSQDVCVLRRLCNKALERLLCNVCMDCRLCSVL